MNKPVIGVDVSVRWRALSTNFNSSHNPTWFGTASLTPENTINQSESWLLNDAWSGHFLAAIGPKISLQWYFSLVNMHTNAFHINSQLISSFRDLLNFSTFIVYGWNYTNTRCRFESVWCCNRIKLLYSFPEGKISIFMAVSMLFCFIKAMSTCCLSLKRNLVDRIKSARFHHLGIPLWNAFVLFNPSG